MFAGSTSSAVIVSSWRISLPESGLASPKTWRPYEASSPAAPDAWPVFSEPVAPIRTMSALPPYCVRFALRKKLVVGGCGLGVRPMSAKQPEELVAGLLGLGRDRDHIADQWQADAAAALGRRGVGQRARDIDRLVVVGRVVVVRRVDVARDQGECKPLRVGVLVGTAGEAGVGDAAVRALHDAGAIVGGVDDRERVEVRRDDERVPDPQRHDLAIGADAGAAEAVVRPRGGLPGAPGPVTVRRATAGGIEGVVVVVEEVPAGDVVDVTVRVGVAGVGERGDQVGAVEQVVGLLIATRGIDPRVAGEVAHVERAVAVGVVGAGEGRARGAAADRVGAVGLRLREFGAVQVDLLDQLPVLPPDAGIEDRDDRVGVAGRVLPGGVGPDPCDLGALRVARRDVRCAALGVELRAIRVRGRGERVQLGRRQRGGVRGVGAEPVQPVLLREVAAAARVALRVVELAVVEVRVVRRVRARALAGVGARVRGQRSGRQRQRQRAEPERRAPRDADSTHARSEPSAEGHGVRHSLGSRACPPL